MLISISIRNYALITSLDVEFRSGLNMITGETGAGKSILLGALSLLLGSRADTQVLKNKDSKCMVEGTFDLIGPDLKDVFESNDLDFETPAILRREITPQGKSRAFINDTPVNLTILRTIGGMLVDIHSQHQNLMINDPVYALHVVDQFGKLQEKLAAYTTCFDGYRQLNLAVSRLEEQLRKAKADQDYLEFQLAQLDEAGLKEGEQESLEKEQLILENAGEIQLQLMQGIHLLNESEEPVLASIKKIMNGLQHIANFDPGLQEVAGRFQSVHIELQDLLNDLSHLQNRADSDPERLAWIVDRLDLINSLEKKHQVSTMDALLSLQSEYRDRLKSIQSSDDELISLKKELGSKTDELSELAKILSNGRRSVFQNFEMQVSSLLQDLGMPNGRFEVHHESLPDFTADGCDEVRFWFSANKNQSPEELSSVASGGETSRLMLSIKSLISSSLAIPTVIFDEIDSGVSGDIADKVGNLISRISSGRQVLNITHLPQVASKGDCHFKVYKYDDSETTHTAIKLLSEEERVIELAQMLSGKSITPEAIDNARVLLNK